MGHHNEGQSDREEHELASEVSEGPNEPELKPIGGGDKDEIAFVNDNPIQGVVDI